MSAANPALILQMLKSAGGGGAPGGAPGGATGAGGSEESVGPATRELQASNPDYALKLISEIKKQAAALIPTLAFKAPAAARAIMSTFKGLDAAIKELQQAAATLKAVGGPIDMSAIPKATAGGTSSQPMMNPASTGM